MSNGRSSNSFTEAKYSELVRKLKSSNVKAHYRYICSFLTLNCSAMHFYTLMYVAILLQVDPYHQLQTYIHNNLIVLNKLS